MQLTQAAVPWHCHRSERFLSSCAVNSDALAVATAKAFSDPTLTPSLVAAYAAAIAQSGCPAVQPALASAPLLSFLIRYYLVCLEWYDQLTKYIDQ